MDCPLCFAEAGAGFQLTLQEVEAILDHFVATEGNPEVVQFSGGEPTIHPDLIPMLKAAQARPINRVMINTNGKRIAHDDDFLAQLAEIRPDIYLQFDGFDAETYRIIRGESDILPEKLKALDRLAEIGCLVILVPAIMRGVNEHEVGEIVKFGLAHPAVYGINFQPAFAAGRHLSHDPLERLTNPDLIKLVAEQTQGLFRIDDFVPVPCCFPTCNSVTYAYVDDHQVTPLTRLLNVDDYLDYIANKVTADLRLDVQAALEGLWSAAAMPGSSQSLTQFALTCLACGMPDGSFNVREFSRRIFMIAFQDFLDPWTFNQKNVMKCCKEFLLPDGKQIPFCAYNNVGYREQARAQLTARTHGRALARRDGLHYDPPPLSFDFSQPYPADRGKQPPQAVAAKGADRPETDQA
jgi:uncharacterized radical SAM superfamily Fe-S cluster-containing enzyme